LLANESEHDSSLKRPYPLDALGAQTQGLLGYWLVRELDRDPGAKPAAALVTRVLVERDDVEFSAPSKFIGGVYSDREATELSEQHGRTMARDQNVWQRVVPSPHPVGIPELPAIADLLIGGNTIVCCGGGGIPVVRDRDGVLRGVTAVVDKDATSALLAAELLADVLLLLTDVDAVYANFGRPNAQAIKHAGADQLKHLKFPAGSMGPKVRAACDFAEVTGHRAAIGAISEAHAVLQGASGTQVLPSSDVAVRREAAVDAAWAIGS